jgi:hypothetical protein
MGHQWLKHHSAYVFCQGEGNIEKQKNIFNISVVPHFFIALIVCISVRDCRFLYSVAS